MGAVVAAANCTDFAHGQSTKAQCQHPRAGTLRARDLGQMGRAFRDGDNDRRRACTRGTLYVHANTTRPAQDGVRVRCATRSRVFNASLQVFCVCSAHGTLRRRGSGVCHKSCPRRALLSNLGFKARPRRSCEAFGLQLNTYRI